MSRKKKHHEEEHENHERWLVSYADFITLLFAFFVVMYSVSRVDNKRLQQVTQSIKWAMHFEGTGGVGQMPLFDGPPSEGGYIIDSGSVSRPPTPAQAPVENVRRKLENRIGPFVMERRGPPTVTIVVDGSRITLRLAAGEFFDAGQAALRPQILPVLDAIAEEVVPLGRPLHVEGHTDATPVASDRYRDNWALSAARAATVVSYLEQAHHAKPELLSAIGYASTRPLSEGATAEANELNRRVELVLDLDYKAEQRAKPRKEMPRLDPVPAR